MLKVGVLGAGHLGKIHLKLLEQSDRYELVGFYDTDRNGSLKLSEERGYTAYDTADKLIRDCEVMVVVTPTSSHYNYAAQVIKAGKHLFIEKPISESVNEAHQLVDMAKGKKIKAQVGHVERYNPAFQAARKSIGNPMFIETHRLSQFSPRGTDVSVVLDLMIHDIDAVLTVVDSKIKNISASGVSVISDTPDIANARIEFHNGCVANLTASRISLKKMRKARFFQRDAYIAVNFLKNSVELVRMKDAPEEPGEFDMILQNAEGVKKQIYFDNPDVHPNNAILEELETFADAIENKTEPEVTLAQATQALEVAKRIISKF